MEDHGHDHEATERGDVGGAGAYRAGSDEAAMREWAELLVARAREEGVDLTGEGGLLTGLVRQVLQTGLEVEMADHLGYERHDPAGRGSGNSRNGVYPKTVTTEIGDVELAMPRTAMPASNRSPSPRAPAGWTACRAT